MQIYAKELDAAGLIEYTFSAGASKGVGADPLNRGRHGHGQWRLKAGGLEVTLTKDFLDSFLAVSPNLELRGPQPEANRAESQLAGWPLDEGSRNIAPVPVQGIIICA
jgi:hypothetical protein